jgi:hypothetical protein
MKKTLFKTVAFALFATGALSSQAHAKGVTGAIFTTLIDGAVVNGNQYNSKCDVYLDGGPGPNAPAKAAGLPDGDYYFQVTDPSGDQLLSTDPVSNRRFTVEGGVISSYSGTHPQGTDFDHGAVTIGLADVNCPVDFLDTPNNGGVYKVWATPVEDFVGNPAQVDNPCGGGCFHGFVAAQSKTDNFKAQPVPITPNFCLTLTKLFHDENGETTPRAGWKFELTDPLYVTTTLTTGEDGSVQSCGLTEGDYSVTELLEEGTEIWGLIVNEYSLLAETTYAFSWDPGKAEPVIVFINIQVESPPIG